MPAKSKDARRGSANLLTNVVLVLPVLVFYEIGVLFTPMRNGADLITQTLLQLLGRSGFIWFQVGLVALMVGLWIYLRNNEQLDVSRVLPVLLESTIYALTMGTLIIFVMVDVLTIDPRLAAAPLAKATVFQRLVMSAGAGIHEEILFRLILLSGFAYAGQTWLGMRRWLAIGLAILISSVLFSGAHHVGAAGDAFSIGVFVYRVLAGVFFAVLYWFRGFATAVYTHTFYDIYVLLLR